MKISLACTREEMNKMGVSPHSHFSNSGYKTVQIKIGRLECEFMLTEYEGFSQHWMEDSVRLEMQSVSAIGDTVKVRRAKEAVTAAEEALKKAKASLEEAKK